MASTRLEILKNLVAQNPQDAFSRYGLAMEYRAVGDLESAAGEFQALLSTAPDYVPAYFHAGQTLELCGRAEEAREVYLRGLEAAARKGNGHARGEIQAALDLLG
jgi:tetratricopeptide (TPR) repeat protein